MSRTLNQILYLIFAAAAFFCIYHAYQQGREQGMDAKINWGAFNDMTAMTIAISENRYGFHEGYIGRPEVMDALAKHLAPDGPMADTPRHMELASNREAIEAALQEATSLDPKTFIPYYGSAKEPFIAMMGEDTGLVNFYRLAFGLFGYHADSMFKLYFLLLTSSTLIFLIAARGHVFAAGALVALLYGFTTLLHLNVFAEVGAPSMYSNRQIGTLSLIATLHILLFLRLRHRYATVTPWLLLLLQAVLLFFTITVRSSTTWQWLLIIGWCSIPILYAAIRLRKTRPYFASLWQARGAVIILLVVLLGLHQLYQRSYLDAHEDVYFTRCTMTHHLRWHSAYLALAHHPDWEKYAPSAAEGTLYGDGLAWWIARTYWKKKYNERYSCKLFPAFPLFGVHDMVMRKEFYRFAGKHPRYIAELYFIYKPYDIYQKVKTSLSTLPDWWWHYVKYGVALMSVAGLIAAFRRQDFVQDTVIASSALLLMLLTVNMPAMFAYASYMAETIMVLLGAMAYLPAALAGIIAYLIGKAFRQALFNTETRLPIEGV